jgi:SAM domain (Sterile alpha motif)
MEFAAWLRGLGLDRYEAVFRENAIATDVLRDLTDQDLEKMGVLLGDRRRLMRAIAELDKAPTLGISPAPTPAPSGSTPVTAASPAPAAIPGHSTSASAASPVPTPAPSQSVSAASTAPAPSLHFSN